MTLEREVVADDVFGLAGTFPRPGWVVLDAAREGRFTGELVFETLPQARVYLDRGTIYLAERVTDVSIGARLVDAGALNAAQLEHGSLRIGDDEHLGRLFERVPSVDRHTVLITAELMTDECVGWLAHQRVDDVEVTPYRHHPSGVHRWDRDAPDLAPGDPLPAPSPTATPVEVASPEPLFIPEGLFTDDMIRWDEPSWLDERLGSTGPEGSAEPSAPVAPVTPAGPSAPVAPAAPIAPDTTAAAPPSAPELAEPATLPPPGGIQDAAESDDWIDRLEADGLPEAGADPLAAGAALPPLPVEPADRFEVIWPSGEVDEQFGATDVASIDDRHPDLDRAGPTARVVRSPETALPGAAPVAGEQPSDALPQRSADAEQSAVAFPAAEQPAVAFPAAEQPTVEQPTVEQPTLDEPVEPAGDEPMTDDVVLAVRRAVASIEIGSVAPEPEPAADDTIPSPSDLMAPGRVALRSESAEVSQGIAPPPTRSVFDDFPVEQPTLPSGAAPEAEASPAAGPAPTSERSGALRRLISSLRRR